jgi:hypothetical protein
MKYRLQAKRSSTRKNLTKKEKPLCWHFSCNYFMGRKVKVVQLT